MLACNESWRSRISPSFSLGASTCSRQKTQKCCLAERSENGYEKKTWSIRIRAKLGVQWTFKLGIVIVGLKWCISRRSVSRLCKRENIRKSWEHNELARRTAKNSIEHHNARRKRFLEVFWFISAAWNLFNTRFVLCKFKPLPCNALQNMFVLKTIFSPACSMDENKKFIGNGTSHLEFHVLDYPCGTKPEICGRKSPRFVKILQSQFHTKCLI